MTVYKLKKTKILLISLVLCSLLLSLASCAETELYSEGEGEIKVVCTTFIPFDIARNVGGEHVTLTVLQDNGADMHSYSPTTATLEALSDAELFIYIGGESDEKWVDDAIKACQNDSLVTLKLMDFVKEPLHAELECNWTEHDHENEEDHGHEHHADEHIWTSLRNTISSTEAVRDALSSLNPEAAEDFGSSSDAYIKELSALDEEYAEAVNSARIKNITVADRFPFVYMFHDYKISYRAAFSGCSSEVNASFETQISLINDVKTGGAKYVLCIEGSDRSIAEAISNETGCGILSLNSLQSVKRSEIMSGLTYLTVMRENLKVIREVLS